MSPTSARPRDSGHVGAVRAPSHSCICMVRPETRPGAPTCLHVCAGLYGTQASRTPAQRHPAGAASSHQRAGPLAGASGSPLHVQVAAQSRSSTTTSRWLLKLLLNRAETASPLTTTSSWRGAARHARVQRSTTSKPVRTQKSLDYLSPPLSPRPVSEPLPPRISARPALCVTGPDPWEGGARPPHPDVTRRNVRAEAG